MRRAAGVLHGWGLAAVVVTAAVGCDSKGLVAVEGRVTFAEGRPPGPGHLFFVPREMSLDATRDHGGPLPGTAVFLEDGGFRAGTFTQGDGLRPCTYEVRLDCSASPAGSAVDPKSHDAPARQLVPSEFRPPELVVPRSGPRPVRYDLDVR